METDAVEDQGADFLDGGDGNDELRGEGGNDTLVGGKGNDLLYGDAGDDDLSGGEGIDELQGGEGNDVLDGGAGADTLFGDAGQDILLGGEGADHLNGGAGDDVLMGGADNDSLWGDDGNDLLHGDDGDDTLHGGAGNDTLDGGIGSDSLFGGEGDDKYVVRTSDAAAGRVDVISDSQGVNTLRIEGASLADIQLSTAYSGSAEYLFMAYDATGAKVAIQDGLAGGAIQWLEVGGQTVDFLEFIGTHLQDRVYGRTVQEGRTLAGGTDSDYLVAEHNNTLISAGKGDDDVALYSTGNTVLIREGDGVDRIDGAAPPAGHANLLEFATGIALNDIVVERGARGEVVVRTADGRTGAQIRAGITGVRFQDGDQLFELSDLVQRDLAARATEGDDLILGSVFDDIVRGEAGNDILLGYEGDDTLIADGGNDILIGGEGNDTYVITPGAGSVTLLVGLDQGESAAQAGADRIVFSGTKSQYTWTTSRVDNSLVVTAHLTESGTSSSVRLEGYFDSGVGAAVWSAATVGFEDGSVLAIHELLFSFTPASEGDDIIYGHPGAEVIDALGGNDNVFALDGNDVVDGGSGDDILDGGYGDDLLKGGLGQDVLTGGAGADVLHGGEGDDLLAGGEGDDILWGDAGNDFLIGESGNDTLYGGAGVDNLQGGEGDDHLDGGEGDDILFGNAGNDVLLGGSGNDVLNGGLGSDTMNGGEGDDLYVFDGDPFSASRLGEVDQIIDEQGADVIQIRGASASEVRVFSLGNQEYSVLWGTGGVKLKGGSDALTRFQLDIDGVRTSLADYLVAPPTEEPPTTPAQANANFIARREYQARMQIEYAGSIGALAWRYDSSDTIGSLMEKLSTDELNTDVSQSSYTAGSAPYYYTVSGYRDAQGNVFATDHYTLTTFTETNTITGIRPYRGIGPNGNVVWLADPVISTNTIRTSVTYAIPNLTAFTEQRIGYTTGYTFHAAPTSVDAQLGVSANTFTFSAGLVNGGDGDDHIWANMASFARWTYMNERPDGYGVHSYFSVDGGRSVALTERNKTLLTGQTTASWINGGAGNDTIVGSEVSDVIYGGPGFNSLDGSVGPDRYLVLDEGAENPGFDYIADNSVTHPLVNRYYDSYGGIPEEILPPGADIDTVEFGPGIFLNELHFSIKTSASDPEYFRPNVGRWWDPAPYLVVERAGRRLASIEFGDDVLSPPAAGPSGSGIEFLEFQDGQKIGFGAALAIARSSTPPGGINHAPTVAQPIGQQQASEDALWSFTLAQGAFSDIDGDTLTYGATLANGDALPAWLSFDAQTRTFSGTPLDANVGNLAIQITATDPAGAHVASTFNVAVANTNDAPVVVSPILNQSASQGALWTYALPAGTFSDVDVGDSMTLSVTRVDGSALPTWLTFNAATKTFSGTPLGVDVGSLALRVTATDAVGATAFSVFDLAVGSTNHAPVAAPIADQQAVETRAFIYALAVGTFTDTDLGDTLSLSAKLANGSALPVWLGFDAATQTFTGTPPDTAAGLLAVEVTAVDTAGATARTGFNLNIANIMIGTDGDDTLAGTTENDVIDGGAGADRMSGGKGDDVYYVDNTLDKAIEKANEGHDTVRASVSFTLGANVENLVLVIDGVIDGTGNALDNDIRGNDQANKLKGGAGDDLLFGMEDDDHLIGGLGADHMLGGQGDDLYQVDNILDVVSEFEDEGVDTVEASVTYTLSSNVENLILTGLAAIDSTGNGLNNLLQGNIAANTLTGGAGNDTLNGKQGLDTLIGGLGNDTYLFEDDIDIIVEEEGGGRDTLISRLSVTLASNVEDGILLGSAISLTGNELSNVLTGNNAANILDGGLGADVLIGGKGNDLYIVDNQADTVIENAGEGTDTVQSSVSYSLGDNVENLILTGTAEAGMGNELNNKLTGNAASNKLWGGAGNDELDGGAGADILIGGLGNDKYWVDSADDLVVENAGEGTDTVYASVSYALADNVERLTLTGSANINAVGNTLNNRLEGNAGNNILFGGLGSDTYVWGRGSGQDIIVNFDAGKPSGDTVQLGADIAEADLGLIRQGNDLILSINGTTDQLTVANYFQNAGTGANALEKIRFADGTSWNHAAVLSRTTTQEGASSAQMLPPEVLAGNPTALFDAPDPAQTQASDVATAPQSVAESIAAAKERFEQGLQNLKYSVDEQAGLSRSEFAERRALPLLWNLQDALLNLQLAQNPDGRFTADISMDSRATRDLGLGIAMLGGVNGMAGRLDQVARPQDVQQFDLAQMQ